MEQDANSTQSTTISSPTTNHQQQGTKSSGFLVSLLSILLLISCLIAGFFAWQTQNLVKELQAIKNEELTKQNSIPTPTPDPTVDWKAYIGSSFTFKYPAEYSIEELDDKVLVRIDPPQLETVEGNCPRYVAFSTVNKDQFAKTTKDKYSCVYEIIIKNGGITIESQYHEDQGEINLKIISTFKFIEPEASSTPLPVACTMDAKICPDGSAVGRSGPKCEFAPCPTTSP